MVWNIFRLRMHEQKRHTTGLTHQELLLVEVLFMYLFNKRIKKDVN